MNKNEMLNLVSIKIYNSFGNLQNSNNLTSFLPYTYNKINQRNTFSPNGIRNIILETNKIDIKISDGWNKFLITFSIDQRLSISNNDRLELCVNISFEREEDKDNKFKCIEYFSKNLQAIINTCNEVKTFCYDLDPSEDLD